MNQYEEHMVSECPKMTFTCNDCDLIITRDQTDIHDCVAVLLAKLESQKIDLQN